MNKSQERVLEALKKASSVFSKKKISSSLPEEKKLFRKEYDSPGLHRHDDDNPFGMHRHSIENSIDGEHIHTVLNPEGEHSHGINEGMVLIDGSHTHDGDYSDLGWHSHEKEKESILPISEPDQILPTNTDVKE